jgi:glycogen operon protein
VALNQPDWGERSHSLAFTIHSVGARFVLHGLLNAYWEPLTFQLPPVPADSPGWRRCLDTALPSPDDSQPLSTAPAVTAATYLAQPRSIVVLARAVKETEGAR